MIERASERDAAKLANWALQADEDAKVHPTCDHIRIDCSAYGQTKEMVANLIAEVMGAPE